MIFYWTPSFELQYLHSTGNDGGQMIMTTTTTTAMMGWTDLVVVIVAADVHSRSQVRTDALLDGPLATSQCPPGNKATMTSMSKDGGERLLHVLMCVIGCNLPETYLCLICLLNLMYCHKNAGAKLGGALRLLVFARCWG